MAYNLPLGSVGVATSPKPGTYPYIHGQQTEAGHMFILDDTPENEQIILQHAKSNTQVWIEPDGSMQTTIAGNNFTVVVNNNNVVIEGVCNIQVYADAKLEVRGSVYAQVNESLNAIIKGDSNVVTEGKLEITAGKDINITSATGGAPGSSSFVNIPGIAEMPRIYLNGGGVVVNGDLQVEGALRVNNSITSFENVIAGYKLFAYGGIETMGGCNIGISVPGPALPKGVLVSTSSVAAPSAFASFGSVGIMSTVMTRDMQGFLAGLRGLFNAHPHPDAGTNSLPDAGTGGGLKPGYTIPFTI